jgi:hypothetical protein
VLVSGSLKKKLEFGVACTVEFLLSGCQNFS